MRLFLLITALLSLHGPAIQGALVDAAPGFLDFDNLPETRFSCEAKVIGGYYADIETGCQMFHVCTVGQKGETMDIKFLCLNGTVFDQETRVCERVDEVDCSKTEGFYDLNLELYGAQGFDIHEEETLEESSTQSSSTSTPTTTPTPTTTTTTTPRPPPPPPPPPPTHPPNSYFPSSSPGAVALLSIHNTFTGLQPPSPGLQPPTPPTYTLREQQHPHGVAHHYFSNTPRPHSFHPQFNFFGRSINSPTPPPTVIATSRTVTSSVSSPSRPPPQVPTQRQQHQQQQQLQQQQQHEQTQQHQLQIQNQQQQHQHQQQQILQQQDEEYDADYALESFFRDVPKLHVARSSSVSVSTSSSSSAPVIVPAPPRELLRSKRQSSTRGRSRGLPRGRTTPPPLTEPMTAPAPPAPTPPAIPHTNFTCMDKVMGGFYADVEADCTVFHICSQGRHNRILDNKFLCGVDTRFDQQSRTCVAKDAVVCSHSAALFHLNDHFRPLHQLSSPEELAGSGFESQKLHSRSKRADKRRGGAPSYTLASLPPASRQFECPGEDGSYADVPSDCQAYHQCTGNQQSLHLCPFPSVFNEALGVCDSWENVDCQLFTQAVYESHKTRRQKRNSDCDNPDIPPGTPIPDTRSNCTRYHMCVIKEWEGTVVRLQLSCAKGKVMDAKLKKCVQGNSCINNRLEKPRKNKKTNQRKNSKKMDFNNKKYDQKIYNPQYTTEKIITVKKIETTSQKIVTTQKPINFGNSKDKYSKDSGPSSKSLISSKNKRWLLTGIGAPSLKSLNLNSKLNRIKRSTLLGLDKITEFTLQNANSTLLTSVSSEITKGSEIKTKIIKLKDLQKKFEIKKSRTKRTSNQRYSRVRKPSSYRAAVLDADSESLEELLELRAALRRNPTTRRRNYKPDYEEDYEYEEPVPRRRSNKRRYEERTTRRRKPVSEEEYDDVSEEPEKPEPSVEYYDDSVVEPETPEVKLPAIDPKLPITTLLQLAKDETVVPNVKLPNEMALNKILASLLTSNIPIITTPKPETTTTEVPAEITTTIPAPPETTTPSTTSHAPETTTQISTSQRPSTLRPYVHRRIPTPVPTTTLKTPVIRRMPLIRQPMLRGTKYAGTKRKRINQIEISSSSTEASTTKKIIETTAKPLQTVSPDTTTLKYIETTTQLNYHEVEGVTKPNNEEISLAPIQTQPLEITTETNKNTILLTTEIPIETTTQNYETKSDVIPETFTTENIIQTTTENKVTEDILSQSISTTLPTEVSDDIDIRIIEASTPESILKTIEPTKKTSQSFVLIVTTEKSLDFIEDQEYQDSYEYYEYANSKEVIPNKKGSQELQESKNLKNIKKFDYVTNTNDKFVERILHTIEPEELTTEKQFSTKNVQSLPEKTTTPSLKVNTKEQFTTENVQLLTEKTTTDVPISEQEESTENVHLTTEKTTTHATEHIESSHLINRELTPPAVDATYSIDFPSSMEYEYDDEDEVIIPKEPDTKVEKTTENSILYTKFTNPTIEIKSETPVINTKFIPKSDDFDLQPTLESSTEPITKTYTFDDVTADTSVNFSCTGREMFHFHNDPSDCRVFHYCSPGFHNGQVLDFRFQCVNGTGFDVANQKCQTNHTCQSDK